MTATATKPRKKTAKPAPKRTVLEARPPMPSYESLVEETGINPDTVLAEYDRLREDAGWQPWSLRGAWEVITGRADWTAWTVADARALRELTDEPEPLVDPADYEPEDPEPTDEPTSLLGLPTAAEMTAEIRMPEFTPEVAQ